MSVNDSYLLMRLVTNQVKKFKRDDIAVTYYQKGDHWEIQASLFGGDDRDAQIIKTIQITSFMSEIEFKEQVGLMVEFIKGEDDAK